MAKEIDEHNWSQRCYLTQIKCKMLNINALIWQENVISPLHVRIKSNQTTPHGASVPFLFRSFLSIFFFIKQTFFRLFFLYIHWHGVTNKFVKTERSDPIHTIFFCILQLIATFHTEIKSNHNFSDQPIIKNSKFRSINLLSFCTMIKTELVSKQQQNWRKYLIENRQKNFIGTIFIKFKSS